jgi:SH3-like domain-containing protein
MPVLLRTVPPVLLLVAAFAGLPTLALAQSGTLQIPAHPTVEQPVRPPSAAPVAPVHQDGPVHRETPPRRAPVVQPRGTTHAMRPTGHAKGAHPGAHPAGHPPAGHPAGHAPAEHPAVGHTGAAKPAGAPGAKPEAPAAVPAAPAAPPAAAAKPEAEHPADKAQADKPKLPRFAALRSDDVNLRAGPGTRYPIEWVYKRRDLPVEIEREFEVWRLVRDMDGIRGWVHEATLTGRRTFVVKGGDATLRSDAKDTASAVALLKVGVIGRIRACGKGTDWCEVQTGSYRGYLRRDQIWGVLPDEQIPAP